MKYVEINFGKTILCIECGSQIDIKTLEIGSSRIILCKKCREKLKEMLSD